MRLFDMDSKEDYLLDGKYKVCAPLVDAVQGEWTRKEDLQTYWYECSVCGEKPPRNQFGHEIHSNYCPNCGARMEETK